jgi:Tfp pilus assembly protein PilN
VEILRVIPDTAQSAARMPPKPLEFHLMSQSTNSCFAFHRLIQSSAFRKNKCNQTKKQSA